MRYVVEVWDKGTLVSREENDDGQPNIQDIEKRLKLVEDKLATKTTPSKE